MNFFGCKVLSTHICARSLATREGATILHPRWMQIHLIIDKSSLAPSPPQTDDEMKHHNQVTTTLQLSFSSNSLNHHESRPNLEINWIRASTRATTWDMTSLGAAFKLKIQQKQNTLLTHQRLPKCPFIPPSLNAHDERNFWNLHVARQQRL